MNAAQNVVEMMQRFPPPVREDAAALIRLILDDADTKIKSAYRVALEHMIESN
jgi:hypothetical protein